MQEHPLLMQGPLVRATLAGLKTQTRRPIKKEALPYTGYKWAECLCKEIDPSDTPCVTCAMRFPGIPEAGDRLWVRETWTAAMHDPKGPADCLYRADDNRGVEDLAEAKWTPSIHMPRWACRLVLPLVSVRVERVQDINEEDAKAEGLRRTENGWTDGANGYDVTSARAAFQELWASIYGQASWDANPWVWVAEWKEIEVSK